MSITIDDRDIQAEIQRLTAAASAVRRGILESSLPRTARGARTEISRAVRRDWTVRAKNVSSGVRIGPRRGTSIDLTISGKPLPATAFAWRANARGIALTARRGAAKQVPRSFAVRGKPMMREGASAYPIRQVYGPSLASMASTTDIDREVDRRFLTELQRQLARISR